MGACRTRAAGTARSIGVAGVHARMVSIAALAAESNAVAVDPSCGWMASPISPRIPSSLSWLECAQDAVDHAARGVDQRVQRCLRQIAARRSRQLDADHRQRLAPRKLLRARARDPGLECLDVGQQNTRERSISSSRNAATGDAASADAPGSIGRGSDAVSIELASGSLGRSSGTEVPPAGKIACTYSFVRLQIYDGRKNSGGC
jgi:hypothetical protein